MTREAQRLLLLGGASALGSLAIQMLVPAMPMIARELHASTSTLQLSITLYLAGLSVGQLVSGPLADHYGRRPTLLGGILLFFAGSVVGALAPSTALLLASRVLQSLGAAAALVAGRSIVADGARSETVSRAMAGLSMVTLVSPTLAPGIGGFLTDAAGWRAVFLVLALAALVLGLRIRQVVSESHSRAADHRALSWRSYRALLGSPQFVRLIGGNASYSMALYVFLAIAPFLMAGQLHMSARGAGGSLLWVAAAMIGGTLLHRIDGLSRRAVVLGKAIAGIGVVALGVLAIGMPLSLWSLVPPMCVVALGAGFSGPAVLARALDLDRTRIGTASSLFGATQTLFSSLAIALVAALHINTAIGLAALIACCITAAAVLIPAGTATLQGEA